MTATDRPITIRLARLAEAPELARMSRDLIERNLHWRWRAPRIARLISAQDSVVLVAQLGSDCAGFAALQMSDPGAHLVLFAVAPAYRRRGVGAALLKWLLESTEVAGCERIDLEVRANNPRALRFYLRHGFETRVRLCGYYDGIEDAVRMRLTLRDGARQRAARAAVEDILRRFSRSKSA